MNETGLLVKIREAILGNIVYFLEFLIPKNSHLWVFGAWFGNTYSDNSKYLFEHVLNNCPEIRPVWVTKNQKVYNDLKRINRPVVMQNSLIGLSNIIRAAVAVLSTGKEDIGTWSIGPNTFVVQLWHGVGYKKILYDDELFNPIDEHSFNIKAKYFFFPFKKNLLKFDMVIATSLLIQKQFSSAFRMPIEKIPITGYPRNDVFFEPEAECLFKKYNKLILYVPTHRQEGTGGILKILPSDEMLNSLNSYFQKHNYLLLIKLHNYDRKHVNKQVRHSNVSYINEEQELDTQVLLNNTDVLIVDYSSIYFDYLLLNRPIIFAPFDIETYMAEDRSFYESYDNVTPGYRINNWLELIPSIEKIFNSPDIFESEREQLLHRYFANVDGNSCIRVVKAIKERLD